MYTPLIHTLHSHYTPLLRSVLTENGFYSGHVMLIVILHTLRQPFPWQLFKLLESVMSWSPCHVRFRWSCSSEDRYTPILLQDWKSLHKTCGTLLHPPSLVTWYPCEWFRGKRSFYLQKNPSLKTGSITTWQGDWGQGNLKNLSRLG